MIVLAVSICQWQYSLFSPKGYSLLILIFSVYSSRRSVLLKMSDIETKVSGSKPHKSIHGVCEERHPIF